MRFLEKLSYGFDTLLMPSERLGEMFEVYFADMCAEKFLLTLDGGWSSVRRQGS